MTSLRGWCICGTVNPPAIVRVFVLNVECLLLAATVLRHSAAEDRFSANSALPTIALNVAEGSATAMWNGGHAVADRLHDGRPVA